jgi:hypothetical protein
LAKDEEPFTLATRWATGASRKNLRFRISECEAAAGRAVRNRRVARQVIDQALADKAITDKQAATLREALNGD